MKKTSKLFAAMILTLICAVGIGASAFAANPTSVTLKPGKTYKSYDITGYKKPDTIVISQKKHLYEGEDTGVYKGMRVLVNGKQVYALNDFYFYLQTKLYTLDNGKPFLYIDATSDDYGVTACGLFRYQSGALKQVVDFHKVALKCGEGQGADVKVKGNTFIADYGLETYSFSQARVRYYYKYTNGTLKRTSRIGSFWEIGFKTAPRSLTTRIKLTAYKSQTSDRKAFTIPAGKSVRIDKCYWNKYYMRFRVKYNGRYGWVKAATRGYEIENRGMFSKQFRNIQLGF